MHGGARGSGGPTGAANGAYRHGFRTMAFQLEKRTLRRLLDKARDLLERG